MLVVGIAGDIKIISQVYLHFFFFIICVHLQNISTIIVFNTQNYYAFLPQREMQKGENFPFSLKLKLMSLISLYNFSANISFILLFVNYFIFSFRERKWKRKGRRQE